MLFTGVMGKGRTESLAFYSCWAGRKGSGSNCSITYHASLLRERGFPLCTCWSRTGWELQWEQSCVLGAGWLWGARVAASPCRGVSDPAPQKVCYQPALLLQPCKGRAWAPLYLHSWVTMGLSLQRKGSLVYSYTKECLNPEGHVWPLSPAWMPTSHPHPAVLPNPLGSHCVPLLQQHHGTWLWFPSEGAAWSYRPTCSMRILVQQDRQAAVFEPGISYGDGEPCCVLLGFSACRDAYPWPCFGKA